MPGSSKPVRSLMVGGTASHVGKSWMATAICAWLRRQGVRVAPFKAQNMSNNSYPCLGGGEIGRAQVAQAEACGLAPSPDMNPILLKPNADTSSQVVVHGKVWRTLTAREYYDHHDWLREQVMESFERLTGEYDFVVIEGAGSVAELNLRRTDLVNLGFAARTGTPVLLVADIDRGGVFASLYGTVALLPPEEAKLVRSFAVNRFRGDPTLFHDGVRILEEKTGRPCLGIFPYAHDIYLDEEDCVALDDLERAPEGGPRLAVLRFPRISNLTDFRHLRWAEWVDCPAPGQFHYVILPGTKNTIGDLAWMRRQGLDEWVRQKHDQGATVIGICGGYQMLGERIEDPERVESASRSADGLRLLPVTTVMSAEKTTVAVEAVTAGGTSFRGYEIHMGQTVRPDTARPFATIDGRPDGIVHDRCIGTYLHGALEDPAVLHELLGIDPPPQPDKQSHYHRLAAWFEESANVSLFKELYL